MRGGKTISITTLIVLIIGCALTVGMWQITSNVIYLRQKIRFDGEVNEIIRLIELKTKIYESSLRSLRASFVANQEGYNLITFKQYVDDILPSLPKITGFAFYRHVKKNEINTYESLIRNNLGYFDSVYSKYTVQPIVPKQNDLFVVEYLFPFEENKTRIGRNVYPNEERRSAIEYAIKNDFAITNQVDLTKSIPKAILLYMPIFDSSKIKYLNTQKNEHRTADNLYGIIGCGFELDKLMNNLLSEYHDRMFIRIHDINPTTKNYTEIYNSNYSFNWESIKKDTDNSLYSSFNYSYGGRVWQIEFKASENYIQPIFFFVPPIIVTLGILITLLVFGMVATKNKLTNSNQKLQESEDRFEKVVDTAPLALVISSVKTGQILLANQRTLEIFAISPNQNVRLSNTRDFYINADDRQILIENLLQNKTLKDLEFRFKRKNGEEFWALVSATLSVYQDQQVVLAGINDISHRKAIENQLRQYATVDSLTNVYNRRHFLELANQELNRAIRFKHSIAVLMLDIDKFKNINDTYGHDIGDIALKKMTQTCNQAIREFDILGRLGGEEFAIILPETGEDIALKVAERIRQKIESQIIDLKDKNINFSYTTSIGLTVFNIENYIESPTEITIDILLSIADNALYQAKNSGRNKVFYHKHS